jgi:hypothetical protein
MYTKRILTRVGVVGRKRGLSSSLVEDKRVDGALISLHWAKLGGVERASFCLWESR